MTGRNDVDYELDFSSSLYLSGFIFLVRACHKSSQKVERNTFCCFPILISPEIPLNVFAFVAKLQILLTPWPLQTLGPQTKTESLTREFFRFLQLWFSLTFIIPSIVVSEKKSLLDRRLRKASFMIPVFLARRCR